MEKFTYVMSFDNDRIKIGESTDPERRLRDFRTSNPDIKLIGILDVPETVAHEDLKNFRTTGEWFCLVPSVRAYLDKHMTEWVHKEPEPEPEPILLQPIEISPENKEIFDSYINPENRKPRTQFPGDLLLACRLVRNKLSEDGYNKASDNITGIVACRRALCDMVYNSLGHEAVGAYDEDMVCLAYMKIRKEGENTNPTRKKRQKVTA